MIQLLPAGGNQNSAQPGTSRIRHSIRRSSTSPAVLPRRQKEIEAELRRIGVPMLTTRLHSRAAFEAIFHFRTTLAELDRAKVDGVDKAIANAETLADEITVTLRKI